MESLVNTEQTSARNRCPTKPKAQPAPIRSARPLETRCTESPLRGFRAPRRQPPR